MSYGAWFRYFNNNDEYLETPIRLTAPIQIPEIGEGCQFSQSDFYADEFGEEYLYNAFYYGCPGDSAPTIVSTINIGEENKYRIGFDTIPDEGLFMACTTNVFSNISGNYTIDLQSLKPPADDALWVWSAELSVTGYDSKLISKNFGFPDRFLLGRVALSYYDYVTYDEPLSYLRTYWGIYEFLSSPDVKDPGSGLNFSFQTVRYRGDKLQLKLNPSVVVTARVRCCLVVEDLNGWL